MSDELSKRFSYEYTNRLISFKPFVIRLLGSIAQKQKKQRFKTQLLRSNDSCIEL